MLKLSIITPNYNYANYIGKTIESVVGQNYKNIEHIIVDDGSTDNSVEIIESYVKRYPDVIKLIKQTNTGQTNALNRALKETTGDVIAWINSDDYYCDNIFQTILSKFFIDNSLDAVFGDIVIVDGNGKLIKKNKYLNFDYASGVFNGFGKIISSNAIFWKRELSDVIGFFNSDFEYAMDSEYWSRLLYKRKVKHIPLVVASFRLHSRAKTIIRKDYLNPANAKATYEDKVIFHNSYYSLSVSNIISIKHTKFLKIIYKIKRIFLRFINGHYFSK